MEVFRKLEDLLAGGRPVAMATVVASKGSTPRTASARMLVEEKGRTWFSVGGGPFEARVTELALEVLASGRACLETFDFRPEEEGGFGPVCGGRATVFIEAFRPPSRLLIVGAGHCGTALARMAVQAGFSVTVADDREHLLSPERFPPGIRLHAVGEGFEDLPETDESTSVAIITRDHRGDLAALRGLVRRPLAYLGMIGSRRKRGEVFEALGAEGVPASDLKRVHCPIGLDIGAETPEEIAVSVLAELVALRRGRPGSARQPVSPSAGKRAR